MVQTSVSRELWRAITRWKWKRVATADCMQCR